MKRIIRKIILTLAKKKCQIETVFGTIAIIDNNYVLANCGHKTLKRDIKMDTGNKIPYDQAPFIVEIEYCDNCLSKMTITCAKCGRLIIIDDEIGLYSPKIENLNVSANMRFYKGSLITCIRCSETGIFGKWIVPGKVLKKPDLNKVEAAYKSVKQKAEKVDWVSH